MNGYLEFEFDLPGALLDRLVESFKNLDRGALTPQGIDHVEEAQGVYQLFLDGELVYIGKSDAGQALKSRLLRHYKKCLHRNNLDPVRLSFKAIRIYVFTAMDLESQLIGHYGGEKNVLWNGSGFGSNDPGRNRDKTTIKPEHFDALYPIDIDRVLQLDLSNAETVGDALSMLKAHVPYLLRFEGGRKGHTDLRDTKFTALNETMTTRNIVAHATSLLPPGWLATKLKSHIILYKEDETYPDAETLART
jgi:hypothetical protein